MSRRHAKKLQGDSESSPTSVFDLPDEQPEQLLLPAAFVDPLAECKGLKLGVAHDIEQSRCVTVHETTSSIKGRIPVTTESGDLVADIHFSSTHRERGQLTAVLLLPDGTEYASIERRGSTHGSLAAEVHLRDKRPYASIDGEWNGYVVDEMPVSLMRADGSGGLQASSQDQLWSVALLLCTFGLYGCAHQANDAPVNIMVESLAPKVEEGFALPPLKFRTGAKKTARLDFAGHDDESKTDLLLLSAYLAVQAQVDVSFEYE